MPPTPSQSCAGPRPPVVALTGVHKAFAGQPALIDFTLQVAEGEFLTLLGASGCGKTTALRLIGGFEQADHGSILLDGHDMRGVPPEARPVNTVFQSYALFPHLNIFDNVAFGLRMAGVNGADIRLAVAQALDLVRLSGMERRKPSELSGGQQQRVAIARAIVNKPRILLLDEPLSALDYRLRKQMQKELRQLQRNLGIAFILVTHDQEEAFAMSDRVVVMRDGSIEQIGSPRQIYEEPVNLHVARFVGEINILDGSVKQVLDPTGCMAEVEGALVQLRTATRFAQNDRIHLLLRPEDFRLRPQAEFAPKEERSTLLLGQVLSTCYRGATYDVEVRLDNGKEILVTEFFDEDAETLAYNPGDPVAVSWFAGWEVVLPHGG